MTRPRVEFSKIKGVGIKNALLFAVFSRLFLHIMVKNNQGWRMRFNSNSVKNSPDYVK